MKRYIYRFFALLTTVLGAWTFAGCADDGETFMTEESGCFKLVVTVPNESPTRADEYKPTAEELGFNEFKVKTLHFYFYNDATSASVYDCVWNEEEFDTQKEITVQLPSSAFLEGGIFGATSTECIVYAVANVDETTLPEGVTLPEGTAKTIAELKALGITSSFAETKKQDSFVMDGQTTATLDRKERKATGTITLERAAAKITLSIDVPTTITVPNTTEGTGTIEYTSNTGSMHVWIDNGVKNSKLNTAAEPVTNADDLYSNTMEAKDGKGSAFTKNDVAEKYKYVQNVPFYSYPNKWEATSPAGNCYLTLVLPWTYTDAGNNTQQITTYYRIPVHPKECTIERNKHYDIRVTIGRLGSTEPQKPIDMKSDWTYVMDWQPQTLETDIKEIRYLLLNNNYYDSTIKNPDGTTGAYYFEMNNTTNIDIPFGTSHETVIASVKMSWIDYSTNPPTKREIELTPDSGTYKYNSINNYNGSTDFAGIELDNTESKLKLIREMRHISGKVWVKGYTDDKGTWGEEDDEWIPGHWEDSPSYYITENDALNTYTFDIVLQHRNDINRTAKVRITQYPGIYIEAQESAEETRFVNNNYSEDHEEQNASAKTPPIYGYVNINKTADDKGHIDTRPDNAQIKPDDYNWDYYLGCLEPYFLGSTINNPYTYIINISRFNNTGNNINEDYIVADPRERTVNNFPMTRDIRVPNHENLDPKDPASWSVEDDNNNVLRYYYPTSDDPNKSRYIAPAYRVASQWGMTQSMTYEGAKRRCASYQENGRPAGRWRLPTIAEIEYIARLSNKGYIPYLFGSLGTTPTYICGSGFIKVDNNETNPEVTIPAEIPTEGFVRCVYDEWYWSKDNDVLTDKTKFTWGDRLRTTSGNE